MNRLNLTKVFNKFLLLFLLVAVSACTQNVKKTEKVQQPDLSYSDKEHAVTMMTVDKKYKLSLYTNNYPHQVGHIHDWTLRLMTPDGEPLDGRKIYVHGGMPQHRHGFPTRPKIKKSLGDGYYLVEGVKFSMPGDWEMRFNIKEDTKRDRVVFHVIVK